MRFAWVDDVMLADGRAVATFAQQWLRDRATAAFAGTAIAAIAPAASTEPATNRRARRLLGPLGVIVSP